MGEITISYAQSLDGRIATSTGDSKWISGDATLTLAHELRGSHEGILVGIGTVLRDDPELTCRIPGCRSPVRIILDGGFRLPLDSRIAQTASRIRTIVVGRTVVPRAIEDLNSKGVETLVVPDSNDESPDTMPSSRWLADAVSSLEAAGIGSIFVEGGAGVITSFLRARLVDRLIVVTAPIIIGEGVSAVGDLGIRALSEALRPGVAEIRMVGNETVHELRFIRGKP